MRREDICFVRAIYATWILVGLLILTGGLIPGWEPSPVFDHLPLLVDVLVGACITLAGVLAMIGSRRSGDLTALWAIERAGLLLGTSAWAATLAINLTWSHGQVTNAAYAAGFTVAAMLGFRAIGRADHNTSSNVADLRRREEVQ